MRRICVRWIPWFDTCYAEKKARYASNGYRSLWQRTISYINTDYRDNKKIWIWTFIPLPYSSDLVPCDCFLFQLIKSVLRGTRFEDVADLQSVVQKAIDEIPINLYTKCFLSWVKRCRKCVGYKGCHLRRNDIVLCTSVLANNNGTDFWYWFAGSRDMTLPWSRLKWRH